MHLFGGIRTKQWGVSSTSGVALLWLGRGHRKIEWSCFQLSMAGRSIWDCHLLAMCCHLFLRCPLFLLFFTMMCLCLLFFMCKSLCTWWKELEALRWGGKQMGGMKKKMERAVEGASRSCTHCLWAVTWPCRVLHGISGEALYLNSADTTLPWLVLLHLMVYLPLKPSRSLIWRTVCQSFWSFPTDELKHPSEVLFACGF